MNFKKILKDKKAVFGLNAVQTFFASILGIGLLAYVIIIIMGSLTSAPIIPKLTTTAVNTTGGWLNASGYTLALSSTVNGFANPVIVAVLNSTANTTIASGNYTLTGNVLTNATATTWASILVTYTYQYSGTDQNNLEAMLGNTSTGITSFFGSINPIYAILAVLVIILVLVVLVRVVQAPTSKSSSTPQL